MTRQSEQHTNGHHGHLHAVPDPRPERLHLSPVDRPAAERAAAALCMRGVQKHGATTVTSALHGLVRDDARTGQEFLALTGRTTTRA